MQLKMIGGNLKEPTCQDCMLQKYRMTIYDFQNAIGVCSPKIEFNKSSWRIAVGERGDEIVVTICKTDGKNSCRLSSEIKLLSFNPNIVPINVQGEDQEFNSEGTYRNLTLTTWAELINPRKNFIQNDSFVIEICVKAGLENSPSKKRRICNNEDSNSIVLKCSECNSDLHRHPISSFLCGHIFCDACSQKVKKCRICRMTTSLTDLRPVLTQ